MNMATDKQISFLDSLINKVGIPEELEGLGEIDLSNLSRAEASDAISVLVDLRDSQYKAQKQDHEKTAGEPLESEIPDGYFTVVLESGHRTFRIKAAGPNSKLAGKRIVSYLSGSDNESDYTGFGFVVGNEVKIWNRFRDDSVLANAAKILVGDPTAAQKGYAMTSGNCYRCARLLTDPESIELGIGPICRDGG